MIYLLGGYLWIYVHRPFEVWPALGAIQFERGYMLLMIVTWLAWPNKRLIPNNLHLALGLFFGSIWLAWMLSPYPKEGETVVENYAKVMVFYVLLVTSVHNAVDLRRLIFMLSGAYALYMLHSFREYLGGRYGYAQGVQRMTGVDVTFADPNQFATCILMSLPLVLAYARSVEGPLRLWLYFQIFMTSACIFLTCSRAGIIGLGFFFVLWVLFSRYRVAGFAALFLVGLLAMAALPGQVGQRMLTLIDPEAGPSGAQSSALGRLAGFLKGIELLGQYPLNGVGPGGFAKASGQGFQAHNLYGQIAGELGTIGLVASLLLLGMLLWNWRSAVLLARDQPWLRETLAYRVMTAVGMGVLLLLLNGMAGHTLYRYNWPWFAALQVIALGCLRGMAAQAAMATQVGWYPEQYAHPDPHWGYLPPDDGPGQRIESQPGVY